MMTAFLYVTLSTAAYYLGARAKITQFLWSRYPSWLENWAICAACSGFWYGLGCAYLGRRLEWDFFEIASDSWVTFPVVGAFCMVWTPVMAFIMTYCWSALIPDEDEVVSGTLYVPDDDSTDPEPFI